MVIGKGSVVMLLCHTIKPSEQISKKYLKIDRGKRLENGVVFYTQWIKYAKKRQDASFSLTKTSEIATLWSIYIIFIDGSK